MLLKLRHASIPLFGFGCVVAFIAHIKSVEIITCIDCNESITLKRLRYLEEQDLTYLFRERKLGEKVEFRFKLQQWKIANGYADVKACDTISVDTTFLEDIENSPYLNCSQSTSTSSKVINDLHGYRGSINIQSVLASHPNGYYVNQTYKATGKLNDAARKILIDSIITWHLKHKIKIGRKEFEHISIQIEGTFNDDKAIYFNLIGSRPSGRLYDKYYNTAKRLKRTGELVYERNNIGGESPKADISNCGEETEIAKAQDWLKIFTEPWNEVQENWRTCFKKRRQEILSTNGTQSSTINVLQNWKLFSHSLGYNLIQIDFSYLHPHSTSIVDKWKTFNLKIIPLLNAKLTDPAHLQQLETIKSQDKGSEQLIALLLHVLLRPTIKRKANTTRKIYRSTIKDSQMSFILHVVTANDVENCLNKLKTSLFDRGETLQPIIIAVGYNLCDAKFYVYFDEIKYEMPCFLSWSHTNLLLWLGQPTSHG
ncbi:uncharacterized protein [Eurosta solidaginis]|uniref:uncharacterized protein n=1 Tax=Eurosta solidaginis TaxID=178769 RepID=UPI00353067FB